MKAKLRKPPIPRIDEVTIRQAIIECLRERSLTAQELSAEVHIEERAICGHLEHIRRSLHQSGGILEITPAHCCRCGFVFTKRDRFTAPGKCPVCRHEAIAEPVFAIRRD